jgi:hypothetical protein
MTAVSRELAALCPAVQGNSLPRHLNGPFPGSEAGFRIAPHQHKYHIIYNICLVFLVYLINMVFMFNFITLMPHRFDAIRP